MKWSSAIAVTISKKRQPKLSLGRRVGFFVDLRDDRSHAFHQMDQFFGGAGDAIDAKALFQAF